MKSIVLVLIPVLAVAACGGSVANGIGGNEGDGGTGSDSGGGGGGTSCPSAEPTSGGSCSPEAITCEYGPNNGICNSTFIDCESGKWSAPPPTPGPACLPSNLCPSSYSDIVVGTTCGDQDQECQFPQGRCTCSEQQGGPVQVNPDGGQLPREWRCEQPSQGCPVIRPRIGSAGSQPGS
ncbi:MAG: hypothetical protein ABI183_14550, partial [Polyangiaceae bacterium]